MSKRFHFKVWFFFSLFILINNSLNAQTIDRIDFSTVKVDELTDAQVKSIINQVEASGLGDEKLEQIAAAKGMPQTEISKLRQRVEVIKKQDKLSKKTNNRDQGKNKSNNSAEKENDAVGNNEADDKDEPRIVTTKIFGAELFSNNNLTFEPNLRLATPMDYQIGPDDQIIIDIYGYSEASYQLEVSPDGVINIPLVGIVPVAGSTIEQASARIKSKLSNVYTGIKTGATQVNISLGNIRSIKVILTGEIVKPGTYTLPSVATVFNALYASGGPNENGSFRQIQIVRSGTVIAVLDVYDFLLYGSLKNNVRLRDQDVIRIPSYKTRVEISGEVKRPGIFEMKYGETLGDLIRFAGDFTDKAYRARIKVVKNTETEHEIQDITNNFINQYEPTSGDQFFVDKILDRFKNRLTIKGAVFRPGQFELQQGMTLKELIQKAEGLREDAFPNRGYITRLKDNLTTEVLSFNIARIMAGEDEDINLHREDIISIPSIFDLKEEYILSIDGEVRSPGVFKYSDNTSLEDLIVMAGGMKEGATAKRVEVSRRIRNSNRLSDTASVAQVFTINIDKDLKEAHSFLLMPFDIVFIRPAPGYEIQKVVRIEGEVLYPGNYTISNKNERISDLIKRAGGLTASAYKEGASLKRVLAKKTQSDAEQEQYKLKQFQQLQKVNADSVKVDINDVSIRNDYVGIDLPRIISRPRRSYDILLEDGDVINVPKELQTVKVSGEVLSPSSIIYQSSGGFKGYILQSGGFSPKALKKRSYVIYANGSIASTKKFLFFNRYPKIKPGSEIFIPKKEERKNRLSTSEVVAISTGLATIATLIFTVFR